MKPRIAIAMSGGVDSSVAAYLLKRQGHDVFGLHFITGYEQKDREIPDAGNVPSDTGQIAAIARNIGIPMEILDIRSEFKESVVDYFTGTYLAGKTPNPCMVCNPRIKFGAVLSAARKWGAACLATGHYAGITKDKRGRFHLLRGVDPHKEQSYFLALLTQQQLASALFPLAGMTKPTVKQIAADKGLDPLVRQESQDICFVRDKTYGEFLVRKGNIEPKPGSIEDVNGKKLGVHQGLHLFTIGQRRGINCPAARPYYVVRMDTRDNRLVIGHREELSTSTCSVSRINWVVPAPSSPIRVRTRVRYRHRATPSTVHPVDPHSAVVGFDAPQSAVTPGQCAVFYRGREVLGGGWIEV